MLNVIRSIFKVEDLRNRVLFTLLILVLFRAGTHIPIPGIDREALGVIKELFDSQIGNILSFFNTFSGGALRNLSIFALGIIPYISASIIMQIMTAVVPRLEKLSQEGDDGRRKISQYTRYLTMVLSLVQGFGIVSGIANITTPTGKAIVITSLNYNYFIISSLITLVAGTAFVMWMGEKINERGIGNGMSIIVFTGILADIPLALVRTFELLQTGELSAFIIMLIACSKGSDCVGYCFCRICRVEQNSINYAKSSTLKILRITFNIKFILYLLFFYL